MASDLVFREGRVTVEISADIEESWNRAAEKLLPTLVPEMRTAGLNLTAGAQLRWPIGRRIPNTKDANRPHSRDLLNVHFELTPTTFGIATSSPVPYTLYILTSQFGLAGRNPWQELVRKPARQEWAPRLARALAEDVGALIRNAVAR